MIIYCIDQKEIKTTEYSREVSVPSAKGNGGRLPELTMSTIGWNVSAKCTLPRDSTARPTRIIRKRLRMYISR
jgi:hypothetical protein